MLQSTLRNVVGGGSVGRAIPLDAIAEWDGATYDPKTFPGVRLRLDGCTVQMFKTGKVVVVGAESEDTVYDAMDEIQRKMQKHGIPIGRTTRKIYNVVATACLKHGLDLGQVGRFVPKSMYEPEHFPGVIIRRQFPKCTILLFASGSMVCVGAESADAANAAVNQLHAELAGAGLA